MLAALATLGVLICWPSAARAAVGWSMVAPMSVPRAQQTQTVLPDGKVLVAGGYDGFVENVGGGHVSLASTELFDPATRTWSLAAPMHVGRSGQTATLLPGGGVLVVGGWEQPGQGEGSETAEIYDPATDTWTATAPPSELQVVDTATLMGDGSVLVTGLFGPHEYGATVGAAEYLPASDTWVRVAAPPSGAERERTAALLPDGDVLLLGGWTREGPFAPPQKIYADAEEFDPTTATWTVVAPLAVPRSGPTATVLPDGTFGFELNQAARVTLSFRRSGPGGAATPGCPPVDRRVHRRRCALRSGGTLAVAGHAGTNRIRFDGALGKGARLLPAGYSVSAVAVAAGVRSKAPEIRFRIVDP